MLVEYGVMFVAFPGSLYLLLSDDLSLIEQFLLEEVCELWISLFTLGK